MSEHSEPDDSLWPSADYHRQLARLRAAVGERIYLVELDPSPTHLAIRTLGQPFVLLDLLPFPRPDPARRLAPHLILLDDGRGVNLGRIARISLERAFAPTPSQILYQDPETLQGLLFRERRLSAAFIAERSRQIMGRLLGAPERTDDKDPE